MGLQLVQPECIHSLDGKLSFRRHNPAWLHLQNECRIWWQAWHWGLSLSIVSWQEDQGHSDSSSPKHHEKMMQVDILPFVWFHVAFSRNSLSCLNCVIHRNTSSAFSSKGWPLKAWNSSENISVSSNGSVVHSLPELESASWMMEHQGQWLSEGKWGSSCWLVELAGWGQAENEDGRLWAFCRVVHFINERHHR